jgi:hypothetical protein
LESSCLTFFRIESNELVSAFPNQTRDKKHPLLLRATVSHEGRTQEIGIVPDLVFRVGFRDGTRRCFAVEIDRGTMPISRSNMSLSSFERKMRGYLSAYATKQHELQFGWKAFRVLTVTTNQHRLGSMVDALRQLDVPQSPGPALFWFGLHQGLHQSDPTEFPWHDGTGQRRALV